MKLSTLLSKDQIILNLKSDDQTGAIEEIVDFIAQSKLLGNQCRDQAFSMLCERETQTSTGIGSGVAIPHAFCEDLEEVVCIFARSVKGLDFQAIDHAPVHFIVLFLVPQKDYCMHLQTLAAIAKMFKNCETRRQLLESETRDDILAVLNASGTVDLNASGTTDQTKRVLNR